MFKYFEPYDKTPFLRKGDEMKLLTGMNELIDVKISSIKSFLYTYEREKST